MYNNCEKDMKSVRDSVNSGMIDDELSSCVGKARSASSSFGRREMSDEEAFDVSAAGDGAFGNGMGIGGLKDFTEDIREGLEKAIGDIGTGAGMRIRGIGEEIADVGSDVNSGPRKA